MCQSVDVSERGFVSLVSVDVIESGIILDGILEEQDRDTWHSILQCHRDGGNTRVLQYLRREGRCTFAMWGDDDLMTYLDSRDLTQDFTAAKDRAPFTY